MMRAEQEEWHTQTLMQMQRRLTGIDVVEHQRPTQLCSVGEWLVPCLRGFSQQVLSCHRELAPGVRLCCAEALVSK